MRCGEWTDDEEEVEVRLANLCHIDEKEEEICECFNFRIFGEKRCFFVFYVCG
jgi:hypothetical protein